MPGILVFSCFVLWEAPGLVCDHHTHIPSACWIMDSLVLDFVQIIVHNRKWFQHPVKKSDSACIVPEGRTVKA